MLRDQLVTTSTEACAAGAGAGAGDGSWKYGYRLTFRSSDFSSKGSRRKEKIFI